LGKCDEDETLNKTWCIEEYFICKFTPPPPRRPPRLLRTLTLTLKEMLWTKPKGGWLSSDVW
jgi:hypothetical protein